MHLQQPALFLAFILLLVTCACRDDPSPAFDVTVSFNQQYTPASSEAAETAIRNLDPDATTRLQETSPPTLVAALHSRREDVCESLLRALSHRADVANLQCARRGGAGASVPTS
ncbi:MAG TPA: hypothetical protein VIH21_08870 [Dehalococcoidia bacterium]|jgi:hypothetical protein